MNGAPGRPRVLAALDEIARWKAAEEAEIESSMANVDDDEDAVRRTLEGAQRQLVALTTFREELNEKQVVILQEADRRSRAALLAGLKADRVLLEERAARLDAAIAEREDGLQKQLGEPDLAGAVEEYANFAEVEATLGSLPLSYRRAILAHHDKVRRRLDSVIVASNAAPPALGLDRVAVTVLFSVDPAEGPPEGMVAVLPVDFALFTDWAERREDLCAKVAYRVIAALTRLLASVGAEAAPVQYNELGGFLVVQVWLGDCTVNGSLEEGALAEIDALRGEAEDLDSAGIELHALWVPAAVLADEEV